jgi:hypothetical protein
LDLLTASSGTVLVCRLCRSVDLIFFVLLPSWPHKSASHINFWFPCPFVCPCCLNLTPFHSPFPLFLFDFPLLLFALRVCCWGEATCSFLPLIFQICARLKYNICVNMRYSFYLLLAISFSFPLRYLPLRWISWRFVLPLIFIQRLCSLFLWFFSLLLYVCIIHELEWTTDWG